MQKFTTLADGYHLDDGRFVKRIMALRDFGNIEKGTIGGFVERSDNLSHQGLCWIADDAVAAGWTRVTGDALLKDRAFLDRHATATDRVVIEGDALCEGYVAVYGDCTIGAFSYLTDGVIVRDFASVFCTSRFNRRRNRRIPNLRGNVTVCDHARLEGRILMCDSSTAAGNTTIMDYARLKEHAYAGGFSVVRHRACLLDHSKVLSHSVVGGKTKLDGNVIATGHCVIEGKSRLLCNVYVAGHVHLVDAILSGDTVRR